MSDMDLLTMLGIDAGEPPVQQQGKKVSGKGKGNTSTKSVKEKAGKIAKPTSSAVRRFETQIEIRKMLVGLDWTVHYAMHTFRVEDLCRQFVEMDAGDDLDSLKATLWASVPQDVKDDLEKAKVARAEAEAAAASASKRSLHLLTTNPKWRPMKNMWQKRMIWNLMRKPAK